MKFAKLRQFFLLRVLIIIVMISKIANKVNNDGISFVQKNKETMSSSKKSDIVADSFSKENNLPPVIDKAQYIWWRGGLVLTDEQIAQINKCSLLPENARFIFSQGFRQMRLGYYTIVMVDPAQNKDFIKKFNARRTLPDDYIVVKNSYGVAEAVPVKK